MSTIKNFVRFHKLTVAVSLFIILFSIIHTIKPLLLYDADGSFRQFGVGYRHKTVIPIWLVSIILGIFSYIAVLYYLAYV